MKKTSLQKLVTSRWFLILMFIFGILIFLYPIISNQYYAIQQNNEIEDYEEKIEKLPTAEGKKILKQAHAYNKYLMGLGDEVFSEKKDEEIIRAVQTGKLPSFFHSGLTIGTLTIPKLHLKLPIRSGSTEDVLQHAVGYLFNTSLPVGGEGTHSVLTGHRGLPNSRLFTDLDQMKIGDVFFVQVLDKPHAYQVDSINIVLPEQTERLGIVPGKDYITLLTCHPYMINTHRLLVRGHRIPYTQALKQSSDREENGFSWWLFWHQYKEYFIGILCFLIILGIFYYREKRKGKRHEKIKNASSQE